MNSQIEKVEAPSREDFMQNYLNRNRPVILTGVISRWRALSEWTLGYLKSVAGDSTITVHFNENGSFFDWYLHPERRVDRKIKFGERVELLVNEPSGRQYYMTEHELRRVHPDLLADVDFSKYLGDVEPCWEPLLFLGRDTCMPLHYHGYTDAFLCQLFGKKKVTLYSPDQHSLLYARPWHKSTPLFSRIDGRQIQADQADYERFPKFKKARPLQFMLEPGEMLFIPVHWWHVTSVPGYQVSITHFWKAKLKCWRFPTPGLQVVAREVLNQSKKAMGRAESKLRHRSYADY